MRKNKKNVIFYREIFRFFRHHYTRIFDIFRYDIHVDLLGNYICLFDYLFISS